MRISLFFFFDGNGGDAVNFYTQCLAAKVVFQQPYDGTPMAAELPPEMRDKIIHAELQIGNSILMLCDVQPGHRLAPERVYIGVFFADADAAQQAAAALQENGATLHKTFWTDAFGMLEDKFGVKWILSTTDTPSPWRIAPFLFLHGSSQAALDFYARCFGGKKTLEVLYGDTPMADKMPAEMQDKVMRAELKIGDYSLWASDVTPAQFPQPMQETGIQLSVNCDSVKETEQIFNALADGGKISTPLEEAFWSDAFGALKDKFGVTWMVNCDKT